MKGFLVMLVLFAAGLAGVFYFRRYVQAPRAPIVASAGEPAREGKSGKDGKERRRRRHGARRLPHNAVPVASAPSSSGEAPPGEAPPGEGTSAAFAPPSEDRAPIPGGSSISESPPEDVLGLSGTAPSLSPSLPPSSGQRLPIDEPPPIKLRAADLKIVWQGEDLSRPETMRLDVSNGGHELTDDEIEVRFRTKEDAVLACIARSRPNEDTFVPGRVTVRFRIQRTGTVKGVQVEAPVILHKGGLTGCIKNVVGSLRFPASNMGQVTSFPFSLM
jgi:hypothetical protein